MTSLPSKIQRDQLNVDRLDKAFVWAASELKAISDELPAYKEWIKIGLELFRSENNEVNPSVFLKIKLPLDKTAFLQSGSNPYLSILEFHLGVLSENEIFKESINKNIIEEPPWVTSLEKYIAWIAIELQKANYPKKVVNFVISLDEQIPFIQIEASFNLYAELFLGGNSFVNSLAQSSQIQSQLLNNTSSFGNSLTVGNN
ncbi:MAG: hypothetical protein ACRC80_08505 [Waterburya sp.]